MATEKRLIDANEFLTEVVKLQALSPEHAVAKIILLLSDMNGVDAVPVVRCRECKHWNEETGFCDENSHFYEHGMYWDIFAEEDFCSYGERKGDGAGVCRWAAGIHEDYRFGGS